MNDNATIDGLDSILKKLTILETKSAGKVLAAIVRAQLTVIGKQMKADVDKKVKEGRKGVRSRFKNSARKNVIKAVVGFGVGKRSKKTQKLNSKGNRNGGVGITAHNIHWWVAGTKQRKTGGMMAGKVLGKPERPNRRAGHNTGRMPSMQPGLASIAQRKSAGQQNAYMIERGALALEKEIQKIKAIG